MQRQTDGSMTYVRSSFNLRRHCSHGCRYCQCPGWLGVSAEEYFGGGPPRPDALEELERDAAQLAAGSFVHSLGRAFLSMVADPYCPEEAQDQTTRQALQIMLRHKLPVMICSKGGSRALRDLDLMVEGQTHFGVSLVWTDDNQRAQWEPNAAPVPDRLRALERAREAGLRTVALVGPVMTPSQGLAVIRHLTEHNAVHEIWVEGLATASSAEWWDFVHDATTELHRWQQVTGRPWLIKNPFRGWLTNA